MNMKGRCMKAIQTNKTTSQIKRMSISLNEFDKRFSAEERKAINRETKYLAVLMSLREIRTKAGLTQQELAQKSKVPRATITKIENILGKKAKTNYSDTPRIGDHQWYISDVSKFKSHFPKWNFTYNIDQTLEEICKFEHDQA